MFRRFVSAGLVLAALALVAPAAKADQILLRNGSMLQGTILEDRTGEEAVHIRLYRDGSVLRVLWDHVLGRDARRLREALGLEIEDDDRDLLILGHRLTLRNGSTLDGLVEKEEGGTVYFRSQSAGRIAQEIPASMVAKTEEIEIDIREVYVTEEIVEMKERAAAEAAGGDLESLDLEAREALGSELMKVAAYDAARQHLTAVAEDESAPATLALAARNKLENLEILARSQEAGDLMNEVKRLRFVKQYAKALDVLAEFESKFGDQPRVRELHRFDRLKKRTEKELREQRIAAVSRYWQRAMTARVRRALADRDQSMRDLTSWATRSLTEEIVAEVAEKVGIERKEVRPLWDARRKRGARTASYGYGSFAAPEELAKAKQRERDRRRSSRNRPSTRDGERNRRADQQKKPLTPEEWWKRATPRDRRNWITAYFVENGDAGFEISRVFFEGCRTCTGQGFRVERSATDSGETRLRCETCNGHGQIRKLRYR